MKKLKFIALFLLITIYSYSQTESKFYKDSTGYYQIDYSLSRLGFIPNTYPPGEVHVYSTIKVYRFFTWDIYVFKKLIGKPFDGIYVRNGCFEDVPANWVSYALKLK